MSMIRAKYLKMENSVCYLETSVFLVVVPVKDHIKPKVISAKENEIKNLETFATFEEVDNWK